MGLRNTRARLKALYGDAHRLELKNREGGGAIARISLPHQTELGDDEVFVPVA